MKYSIGSIIAATACLCLLVLTATAPTIGPAWQQTTSLGVLAGDSFFRTILLMLALLALQPVLFGWKMMQVSDRIATIMIATMPLVLAASPAPVLTADGSLLRSATPHDDLKLELHAADLAREQTGAFATVSPIELFRRPGEELGRYVLSEGAINVGREFVLAMSVATQAAEAVNAAPDEATKLTAQAQKDAADADIAAKLTLLEPADPVYLSQNTQLQELIGQTPQDDETLNDIARIKAKIGGIQSMYANLLAGVVAIQDADPNGLQVTRKSIQTLDVSVTWSRFTAITVATLAVCAMVLFSRGFWIAALLPIVVVVVQIFLRPSSENVGSSLSWLSIIAGISVLEVFLIGALALRMFLVSNFDFWGRMRRKDGALLVAKTFVLWLPLAACILAATLLAKVITEEQIDLVYAMSFTPITDKNGDAALDIASAQDVACADEPTDLNGAEATKLIFTERPYCGSRELERDIKTSINYWMESAKATTTRSLDEAKAAIAAAGDQARVVAETEFNNFIPDRIRTSEIGSGQSGLSDSFNLPHCRWYQFGCHIRRKINKAIDNAYVDRRARLKADYMAKVDKTLDGGEQATTNAANVAGAEIPEALDRLEAEIARQAWAAFRAGEVLSILSRLLAIIAALKSFGFMLGRVAFADPKISRKISMGRGKDGAPSWKAVVISSAEGLTLSEAGKYRVALGINVDGTTQSGLWLYQPHKQTLKRLVPFRHLFQAFEHDPVKMDVTLPCGNVNRIVAIRLENGQRIGYFPKYLHAFRGTPKFDSHWSFRVGHMIQGRMRMCTIEAPDDGHCTIFLRSSEGAQVMRSDMTRSEGMSPARLMAWSDGLDLDVNCRPGFAAIYTSSTLLKPYGEGFALFDGPTGRNRFGGAITFIPSLFVPL